MKKVDFSLSKNAHIFCGWKQNNLHCENIQLLIWPNQITVTFPDQKKILLKIYPWS